MTHTKTEYIGPCLYRGKRLDNGEWVEGPATLSRESFSVRKGMHVNRFIVLNTFDPLIDYEDEDLNKNHYEYIGMSAQSYYQKHFNENIIEIDPETLSVWTGLEDKNGVKIFGGDVVSYKELIPSNNPIQKEIQGADFVCIDDVGVIQWDSDGCDFMVCLSDSTRGLVTRGDQDIRKLGNIWDNPELLGGRDGE